MRTSRWTCAALLAAAVVALVLGALALYGRSAVLDERAFADRATAALAQDEVRDEVAQRLANREIEAAPELAPQRPALEAAVADVVADRRFDGRFHAGATALHHGLFGAGDAALALPGTGAELHGAVAARAPHVARLLPAGDPELMRLDGGPLEAGLVHAAPWSRRLAGLAPLALALGLVLLVTSALRAPTRRRGARRAALGIALAGGAIVAATTIARAVVLSTFDTSHGDAVVGTIWDAFLGDLRLWGLAAGALGLIVAAAFEPGARGAWRGAIERALTPRGAAERLARAGALALLAVLLVWMPAVPLDLAAVSGAGLLVFSAAAEVVRISTAR
ncbi:MAG TPA: hypothetical protein VFG79_23865 [Solirubrobacter sp.]|nr:hypothetical protein [Solirubrobacter sp.]